MASNRIGRINEEMQRELAELIRSLKDPRVQGMISVTGVETTPGSALQPKSMSARCEEARPQEALRGLKSAGGWLRRELGSNVCSCAIRRSWILYVGRLAHGTGRAQCSSFCETAPRRQEAAREAEKCQ